MLLYIYIEEVEIDMGRVGEGSSGKTYMSCTVNTQILIIKLLMSCLEWLQEMPPFLQLLYAWDLALSSC